MDETFAAIREAYLREKELGPDAIVLDLGCGAGVAARNDLSGKTVGIDFSRESIDATKHFTS